MDASDLSFLLESYYQLHPEFRDHTRVTLLLDEVQLVSGWETFARRILDSEKIRLFLSGSSAAMLSREVHTSMRGRAMEVTVFPFSFREALSHQDLLPEKDWTALPKARRSTLEKAFRTYLTAGGFPDAQNIDIRDRRPLLQGYVDVAVLRDIIERHGISNPVALRWLQRHLLGNPAAPFSIQKFYETLKSQGLPISKDSLHAFLAYFEDAFLIRTTSLFSASERQRMVNPRKAYPIDPGLIPSYERVGRENLGHALETAVLIELYRRGCEVHYFRTPQGNEVDFHAADAAGNTLLIQVCADARIRYARTSLGLLYFQPKGHYIIGLAHFRLGELAAAKDAFLTCVTQAPLFAAGFRMLGQIARFEHDAIGQSQNALRLKFSRERLAALRDSKFAELQQLTAQPLHGGDDPETRPMPELQPRPETLAGVAPEELITLVSGLPRSGTSLMMQLLEAAGLPAFTDGRRVADASNENGYYEHDQVAGLLTSPDKSWLAGARGHSLKVVAPLLAALPLQIQNSKSNIQNLHYRVLFMEREMDEILESQDSMLTRLGKPTHPGADIAKAYRQQVRHAKTWLTGRGIPAMSVSYADLVHRPDQALPPLAAFLGVPEKLAAMRAVIDPTLHRARRGAELGSVRSGDLTVASSSPTA